MHGLIKLIKRTYNMAAPHESKSVMKNVAFLSGLQAITYILPIIILPYLFRTLGPAKFGLISFAQAFVQYFMILTDYGFSLTATKEISLCHNDQAKMRKTFSCVMTLKLILLVISAIILGTLVYFIPKFQEDWLIYVFSFGIVVGNALFPVWFFQGTEKMKYIAGLSIAGELILVTAILVLVKGPADYLMIPIIMSSVFLATGLLGQYIVCTRFKVFFKLPGYKSIVRQLKAGWNIFVSVIAINSYTTTRIFAVGLLTNNTLTGFYSIAEKIANVAQTFPLSSFTQALFPRLSKIFHKNKQKAFNLMAQIQRITIWVTLVCLPVLYILAPWIVKLVCGEYYQEVILSLQLLLISVCFVAANAFRVQFLLVCGKTETYSKIHVTAALFGLPLIILLIYGFSYVGAAGATVLIEAGIFAMTFASIRKIRT